MSCALDAIGISFGCWLWSVVGGRNVAAGPQTEAAAIATPADADS